MCPVEKPQDETIHTNSAGASNGITANTACNVGSLKIVFSKKLSFDLEDITLVDPKNPKSDGFQNLYIGFRKEGYSREKKVHQFVAQGCLCWEIWDNNGYKMTNSGHSSQLIYPGNLAERPKVAAAASAKKINCPPAEYPEYPDYDE